MLVRDYAAVSAWAAGMIVFRENKISELMSTIMVQHKEKNSHGRRCRFVEDSH